MRRKNGKRHRFVIFPGSTWSFSSRGVFFFHFHSGKVSLCLSRRNKSDGEIGNSGGKSERETHRVLRSTSKQSIFNYVHKMKDYLFERGANGVRNEKRENSFPNFFFCASLPRMHIYFSLAGTLASLHDCHFPFFIIFDGRQRWEDKGQSSGKKLPTHKSFFFFFFTGNNETKWSKIMREHWVTRSSIIDLMSLGVLQIKRRSSPATATTPYYSLLILVFFF